MYNIYSHDKIPAFQHIQVKGPSFNTSKVNISFSPHKSGCFSTHQSKTLILQSKAKCTSFNTSKCLSTYWSENFCLSISKNGWLVGSWILTSCQLYRISGQHMKVKCLFFNIKWSACTSFNTVIMSDLQHINVNVRLPTHQSEMFIFRNIGMKYLSSKWNVCLPIFQTECLSLNTPKWTAFQHIKMNNLLPTHQKELPVFRHVKVNVFQHINMNCLCFNTLNWMSLNWHIIKRT